ncbi:transposable element Tcb2 transposase [Trichonephila clavipes]|nr:transposable element Tcb2 transposase [Trichonephila clavipes]
MGCFTCRIILHWCAKIKDEDEKLAYKLNEEAERTERPIRRLSKVMYGSTCAGIILGSRTYLHIFDAGSVNGTRYCNEILLPYVRLFRGAMGLQFLFMDDNAPCHRTVAAEQFLEREDIQRMDWPARSPDLIPIEHVLEFLGRRLAARTLPPVTIRELRLALQDEWAVMPQQLIHTLILSMGRRCETCLAFREIISPTKDRMFLAGQPSQGCFGLQSHCASCYVFNQASFYPSDFSFIICPISMYSWYAFDTVDLENPSWLTISEIKWKMRRKPTIARRSKTPKSGCLPILAIPTTNSE